MNRTIYAAIAQRIEATDVPTEGKTTGELVYLPEGKHTLTPYVDGKAKTIEITIDAANGEKLAQKLQASLDARKAKHVQPWLDFDHAGKVSAGTPSAFRYEAGKGMILGDFS